MLDGRKPLRINDKFGVRQTTRTGRCVIKEIIYKMDLEKLKRIKGENCLHKNDIARIKIKTTTPFFFDAYRKNRNTGSFILIDENSLNTVGAGMINN